MADDAAQVTGKVESVFFSSPDSLFKILLVKITKTNLVWKDAEIVVKGSFGDIKVGEAYQFTGHLETHTKYGQQLAADNYHSERRTSRDGLIAYLASDRFPGIGKKTAERIVDGLGLNAVDTILSSPETLATVGVKGEKAATLIAALKENLGMEQVVIGLNGYGLSGQLAAKIFAQYREDSLEQIKQNPYQLIEDIEGIGFQTADSIAGQLGYTQDDPKRLAGALQMALLAASHEDGDTYLEAADAFDRVRRLLHDPAGTLASDDVLLQILQDQVAQHKLVLEDGAIFSRQLYRAEWRIASQLASLLDAATAPHYADGQLDKTIKRVQRELDIDYDDTQMQAIKGALTHRLFLLTGGPGTGKTTIINAVVHAYAELNQIDLDPNRYKGNEVFPIMLAAPTGRAAKRMTETTGLPAGTIHRLLGLGVDQADYEPRELPDGLLIIDEMSMVDTYLMKILLNSVHPGMTLIFVGDKDQLPSVGPGQVFADMLSAGVLPAVALTHIHRQGQTSSIVALAHAINQGKLPDDLLAKHHDRSFIPCTAEQIPSAITQVVRAAVQRGFDPLQVQVLAPMYRGTAGIDRLNPLVQDVFNANPSTQPRKELDAGNQVYRIGDKVLQLVNNPDKNVFNGEIGKVVGIDLAKGGHDASLTLDFDGNEITATKTDLQNVTLAYATTIHKAQGSEFKMVILPLTRQSQRMLKRNLLYTAVTRAKDFLILVGEPAAFELATTTLAANRKTGLKRRIREAVPGLAGVATDDDLPLDDTTTDGEQAVTEVPTSPENSGVLTMAMIETEAVDPLIGMAGVTPYTLEKEAKES